MSTAAVAAAAPASNAGGHHYFARTVLAGSSLTHPLGTGTEPLSDPDDIVTMNGLLFVGFQNGVPSTGGTSPSGNPNSTLVEFTPFGKVLDQWDLTGKIDGMGADPCHQRVIATVNEDGNSSLYTVNPGAPPSAQVTHYTYNANPLPHEGGTDAVSVYRGQILISASAPTVATGPAVYSATLDATTRTASLAAVFYDNSSAISATTGAQTTLALTDPDSNIVVPDASRRFAGDFMLDSQGDQEQIYVHNAGGSHQRLFELPLTQSVDDTAWATSTDGAFYVTDQVNNTVDAITGHFNPGQAVTVATPCDANNALPTCGPNYLASLDVFTGAVSRVKVSGVPVVPHGGLFLSFGHGD
jgi:hypothetical protein